MKLIICFRHLKYICRKWCRGMDYSWHAQHLLREFGCGPLADLRSVSKWKKTLREATVSVPVTSDPPADRVLLPLYGGHRLVTQHMVIPPVCGRKMVG